MDPDTKAFRAPGQRNGNLFGEPGAANHKAAVQVLRFPAVDADVELHLVHEGELPANPVSASARDLMDHMSVAYEEQVYILNAIVIIKPIGSH